MLISFTLRNFKSFKDEMTLSLFSEKDTKPTLQVPYGNDKEVSILPSVALYGTNASGKTNLILGLVYMQHFIVNCLNVPGLQRPLYDPFLLDKENPNKSVMFEVVLILNNTRFQYGFEYNQDRILSEWLYSFSGMSKFKTWFQREWKNNSYVYTDNNITPNRKKIQEIANTRDDALYLAIAGVNYSNAVLRSIYDWFRNKLVVNPYSPYVNNLAIAETADLYLDEPQTNDNTNIVLDFMKNADLHIDDVQIEREKIPVAEMNNKPPTRGNFAVNDGQFLKSYQIQLSHKGVYFDLNKESSGTIKMFSLASMWYKAIHQGKTLVIDELNTSLHPDLVILLLKYFNNSVLNPGKGQLIFSTHDTSIMHAEYLSREQIWFCVKNLHNHASEIYSLLDFGERADKSNYERQYRDGRYGAIPTIHRPEKW
ncbi:MAG: ATP-binding protein [Burkholderiales bacterium]|nr:ATP-binding protein [Burkholderiales bacterium]